MLKRNGGMPAANEGGISAQIVANPDDVPAFLSGKGGGCIKCGYGIGNHVDRVVGRARRTPCEHQFRQCGINRPAAAFQYGQRTCRIERAGD